MSSITTQQGILHYEVYGRGRPVILLHGWLCSWSLWQETMAVLGEHFRTYALDFWGFGESGRKNPTFHVTDYVSMVNQFMEQLGIDNAPLVGHSMGGTVSLMMALEHPERVSRVAVIGSPIDGNSLAFLLKLAGYPSIAWLVYHNMWALKIGLRVAGNSVTNDPRWPSMMDGYLSRLTLESFLLSIASLRHTNLTPRLPTIQVPVMGMYGLRDNIVNPNQWKSISDGVAQPYIERFKGAGHFVMLDEPDRFNQTLFEFLEQAPGKNGKTHA